MVVRLSGTQPQGPKHLETLENKTVDGTQNTVRVNRGTSANRPIGAVIGDLYYNTEFKDLEQYTEDGWMLVAKQPPRIPTIGSASLDGSNNASVSFTPSAYGQPASSYTVQSNPGSFTATGSSSPISISGSNLEVGTSYTFRVKSYGTYGESGYSAYTSTPVVPIELGDFQSIATATVGVGGTPYIEFTSIPQNYKHLQIRSISYAADSSQAFAQFNGDNGSNYSQHILGGNGSVVESYGYINQNNVRIGSTNYSAANTSMFAVGICDILDYNNTNKYKTTRSLIGNQTNGTAGQNISLSSGSWRNLSAITNIKIFPSSGNFSSNSQFALYGIKG